MEEHLTDDEKPLLNEVHAQIDTIGWKIELPGFSLESRSPPSLDGIVKDDMVGMGNGRAGTTMCLEDFISSCVCAPTRKWTRWRPFLGCAHNAVRSAQLGSNTVPNGFDPLTDGGAIHERRHSLTWALSPGTSWDETDFEYMIGPNTSFQRTLTGGGFGPLNSDR